MTDAVLTQTSSLASPNEWLQLQFARWQKRRKANSMRSFARRLNLSPAHLANMLAGRRSLTTAIALRITPVLAISNTEEQELLELIHADRLARKAVSARVQVLQSRRLEDAEFRSISEWHHFGILANATLGALQMDQESLGKQIGVTGPQMRSAYRRLLSLGLLEETRLGLTAQTSKDIDTTNDVPSQAIRQHHQQVLERAECALALCTVNQRQFESLTCAIDPADLPVLKRMISDFHDRFKTIAARGKHKTAIYLLGMQLFPAQIYKGDC